MVGKVYSTIKLYSQHIDARIYTRYLMKSDKKPPSSPKFTKSNFFLSQLRNTHAKSMRKQTKTQMTEIKKNHILSEINNNKTSKAQQILDPNSKLY